MDNQAFPVIVKVQIFTLEDPQVCVSQKYSQTLQGEADGGLMAVEVILEGQGLGKSPMRKCDITHFIARGAKVRKAKNPEVDDRVENAQSGPASSFQPTVGADS